MTGTRPCSQCAKRRKAIEARKALLKSRGKKVQAATLGAVLAVTDAAAKLLPGNVDSRDFAETAGNSIADQIDAQFLRHVTGEEGEHAPEHRNTDHPFNEPISSGSGENRG